MADYCLPRCPQQPGSFDTTPTLFDQQLDYLNSTGVSVQTMQGALDETLPQAGIPVTPPVDNPPDTTITSHRHPQRRAPVPRFSSPQTSPEHLRVQPRQRRLHPCCHQRATRPLLSASIRSAFVRLTRAIRLTLRRRRQAGRSPQHPPHRTRRSRRGQRPDHINERVVCVQFIAVGLDVPVQARQRLVRRLHQPEELHAG